MPLLEITTTKKLTVTVLLEESIAKQVDQYAAFIKAPADEVVNSALAYVFGKDRDFQVFRTENPSPKVSSGLRVRKPVDGTLGKKRGRKAANSPSSTHA
jgi:hypothetical protein